MINLLVTYEFGCPTVEILRSEYKSLFDKTDILFRFVRTSDISSKDLNWSDLTILVRPTDYTSLYIAKTLHRYKKTVWTFWDDDIPLLPYSKDDIFNTRSRRKLYEEIIKQSDILLTCNCHIGEKYKNLTLNKKYILMDTYVSEEEIEAIPGERNDGTIKIVYAANPDHTAMFESIIGNAIVDILHKYRDKVAVDFIGVCPLYEKLSEYPQVSYYPAMPFSEYRKFMIDSSYDIGLAPLFDNQFCKSKYFNKFIEYSLAGIVGIYSNCEPYTFVVEDCKNGFLTNNNYNDWMMAICKAVEDNNLRKSCRKSTIALLKDRFSKERIIERYISNIPIRSDNDKQYCFVLTLIFWKILSRIVYGRYLTRIAFQNIKNRGFINTVKKTVKYIFRKGK